MQTTTTKQDAPRSQRRHTDEAAFRRLFLATYPVFFVLALIITALRVVGVVNEPGASWSVFQRARIAASEIIPFAFMG
jgi:hypothetical protein